MPCPSSTNEDRRETAEPLFSELGVSIKITFISKTIMSVMVQMLVIVLPMLGVRVGSDDLTVMVQTIAVIIAGVVIWIERVRKGDVNVFGAKD